MKTNNKFGGFIKALKGFTLVELIVGVSIFAILAVLGMATFSMSMGSKSKIAGLNELRSEGNKIMNQIEEMVDKGNILVETTYGARGVAISNAGTYYAACDVPDDPSVTTRRLESYFVDSNKWRVRQNLDRNSNRIRLSKRLYTGAAWLPWQTEYISSDKVRITGFDIWGHQKNNSCLNTAVLINVRITIESADVTGTGQIPSLTLVSSFTSKYPNPDQAGD
jgi:prepilin-type N-terminal cleavage/methylation domain-containing protein